VGVILWKLSRDFEEKWLENIGPPLPTSNEIEQMINGAIILQKQRGLFTSKGRPYRLLAMYWNPEKAIVLKVDHKTNKAVTLINAT